MTRITVINNKEVEYDNTQFEVLVDKYGNYLHYIGDGKNITNPKNNTVCYRMFKDYNGKSLDLHNFDIGNIEIIDDMFKDCKPLEKIILSDKSPTDNIIIETIINETVNIEYVYVNSL